MHNGARCHSPALRGKNFCFYHARLHTPGNQSGLVPVTVPAEAIPLHIPFLEDRSAIQVALSRIVEALAASRLEPRRAGMLLYALQIATQNVERKHDILPFKSVESITHTRDGDELAPELRICESSDKCATCDERDTCNAFEPEEDEAEA